MVTQYEMDLEKAKDQVRVYDARIETLHYRAQDLQSDLLRRRSDLNEITSDKILKRFEALCYYIDEWVASQVPWEDVPEPMFVDNGDLNLADLLKDDDHIGEEIITTLVHQCLQREFFGDHIYLVGLPEDYTDFLQAIQSCMAKPRQFERTRGRTTMITRSSPRMLIFFRTQKPPRVAFGDVESAGVASRDNRNEKFLHEVCS
jgi:hypothetical protein